MSMTCQALEKFEEEHGLKFKKITPIALEGDGTIERKVSRYGVGTFLFIYFAFYVTSLPVRVLANLTFRFDPHCF